MDDESVSPENQRENMTIKQLIELNVPAFNQEQLAQFSEESLHSQEVVGFDPVDTVEILKQSEGKRVLSADFGGDKGKIQLFEVIDGALQPVEGYADYIQGDDGKGYLDTIKKATKYAEEQGIPMGLSWGGPLEGTKMVFHPKAKTLMTELEEQYGGDFGNISPSLKTIFNDGPAGLVAGSVHAQREYGATDTIFVINGGGLGVGILKDGKIFATEAGHVRGVNALNTYSQTTACGVFGAEYTCMEILGSNKKGIEAQWTSITGADISAKEIEDEYKKGDSLALELYDHSASVIAHTIQGVARTFKIDLNDTKTAIICDGSAFKFPGYSERVSQIIESNIGKTPQTILTKDRVDPKSNIFMEGVAIVALTAK